MCIVWYMRWRVNESVCESLLFCLHVYKLLKMYMYDLLDYWVYVARTRINVYHSTADTYDYSADYLVLQ